MNTMDHNNALREFILDPARKSVALQEQDSAMLFIKVPYDQDFDFLYMTSGYKQHPLALDRNLEFQELIHYPTGMIYDADYKLRYPEGFFPIGFMEGLQKEAEAAIRARIDTLVGNKPVPVTENAEPYRGDGMDDYVQYYADKNALDAFYAGKTQLRYTSNYTLHRLDTAESIRLIADKEQFIKQQATRYVEEQARYINHALEKNAITQPRLDALHNTPGEHHLRLAISKSIRPTMKTVKVVLRMDDVEMIVCYNASTLSRCSSSDTYYSTYQMDALSRKMFEKQFGRQRDVYPRDIVSISYAGKTIYSKEEL